jgi:hypothetical protein
MMKIVSKKASGKEETDLSKRVSPIDWKTAIYSADLNFIGSKGSQYR